MMFLAATGVARAQDEGVKQIEQLIKTAKSQVEAIGDAKQQLQKTMAAYNTVLAPDVKDRRDAYKSLQKEIANSEKKRADVATRSKEMNARRTGCSRAGTPRRPRSRARNCAGAARSV